MDRRVVITGLGAVTPCGNSPEELWNSLMAGRHGFELAPWFPDQEPDNLSVVSRVKNFDASEYFDKKELRRNDVIVQYAVYCAMQALKDAGTDLKDIDPYRVGVVIGSGIGGIYTTEEEMANYHNKGNKRVGVFTITKMIGNMAAGEVAIRTGFKGSNFCVTTACASGTQSIGEAFRSIKHGYLDAAIAGGTEHSDIGFCYASFNNMHAVTRSTDVDRASQRCIAASWRLLWSLIAAPRDKSEICFSSTSAAASSAWLPAPSEVNPEAPLPARTEAVAAV